MKKVYTRLLLISIICAIISLLLCFISIKTENFDFSLTESVVDEVNEMESDNPGGGWYFLFAGGSAMMLDFAIGFFAIFFVFFVPAILYFIIVLSQIISRIVQIGENKKWKNITSKVFTYISVIFQVILCIILLICISSNFALNKILLSVVLILNIVCVILSFRELRQINKNTV